MANVELNASITTFNDRLHAERAFKGAAGVAKTIGLYTNTETLGYGIFLYQRTILAPNGRALDEDRLLLSLTPLTSFHTNAGLRRKYLDSSGLPADLMKAAFTEPGTNPNLPPIIIDGDGNTHLLEHRKSQGQGFLWYKFNSGPSSKAA